MDEATARAMEGLWYSDDDVATCRATYISCPQFHVVTTGCIKHQGFMNFAYRFMAEEHPEVLDKYGFFFYDERSGETAEVTGPGDDQWNYIFTGGKHPRCCCAGGLDPSRGLHATAVRLRKFEPLFHALYRRDEGVIVVLISRAADLELATAALGTNRSSILL